MTTPGEPLGVEDDLREGVLEGEKEEQETMITKGGGEEGRREVTAGVKKKYRNND